MTFIDEMTLTLSSGKGGDGVVRWLHLKGKEFSGACGGDGGRGGDVYFRAVRDLGRLAQYRHIKSMKAQNGGNGASNSKHGGNGDDLIVDVPIGSVITEKTTHTVYELLNEGEMIQVLRGGKGGYGNEHFKGSRNVTPQESTKGSQRAHARFYVELQIIADIGVIGFPNAGKSTLLNTFTNADSKVGAYAFTTREPHLGVLYGYVLADVPGLLEGASTGRGLGHKFLRHINRTKMILHCISLETDDVCDAYKKIRHELEMYSSALLFKDEIILLTKTDMVTDDVWKEKTKELSAYAGKPVYTMSIYDEESIKKFSDTLMRHLGENKI